jgi:predicted nucleic acid-binding protein
MPEALYLDTSAVLRAVLETGSSPDIEGRIREANVLVTSRLSLVESARALVRLRVSFAIPDTLLGDTERAVAALWARCDLWELTPQVCDLAGYVAPGKSLRALDALHLSTFVLAPRRIVGLQMLTIDERLRDAADAHHDSCVPSVYWRRGSR